MSSSVYICSMNKNKYSQTHDLYDHICVLNVLIRTLAEYLMEKGIEAVIIILEWDYTSVLQIMVVVARIKIAENKNLTKAVLIESSGGKRNRTQG